LPFKEPALPLRDILAAIAAIESFTEGMDFEAFRTDAKTVSAVERKLQVISEAEVRLGDDAEHLCPGPPWRNIRGIGNWLRHHYDRVELDTLWKTIKDDLPALKTSVQQALGRNNGRITGTQANDCANRQSKIDNRKSSMS
jgi:uncharacterized protein with HEPN domain